MGPNEVAAGAATLFEADSPDRGSNRSTAGAASIDLMIPVPTEPGADASRAMDIMLGNAGKLPLSAQPDPGHYRAPDVRHVLDAARYVTGVTLPVDAGFTNMQ